MADVKRATVYFDSSLHKALRVKAAQTEHSVSDLVNAAVRRSLAEDAGDYRVLYSIDDTLAAVVIVRIGHRREVYR